MPFYEFECPQCRRTTEEFVPMGTSRVPCSHCRYTAPVNGGHREIQYAERILSPTPTSFVYASRVTKQ